MEPRRHSGTRRAVALALGLSFVVMAMLSASCQDPTEITLAVTTNAACGTELTATAFYVGSSPAAANDQQQQRSPVTETSQCVAGDIGTLVVTPGAMSGAVVITAGFGGKPPKDCVEGSYDNCIVARRSFSFIKHTPLRVPVVLEHSCLNVPCDVNSTCHNGACYAAGVVCGQGGCSQPGDADAGSVDAGPGAILDGAGGGTGDGATDSGGAAGEAGGHPIVDSGTDGSPTAGTDAGRINNSFDAGGMTCSNSAAGLKTLMGCGVSFCSSASACCVTSAATPACHDPSACQAITPTYCCEDAQCFSGTCCLGTTIQIPAPPSRANGMVICSGKPAGGGPPGTCL